MSEADAERAAVVKWLRRQADEMSRKSGRRADRGDLARSVATSVTAIAWAKAADAIERGDHIKETGQ